MKSITIPHFISAVLHRSCLRVTKYALHETFTISDLTMLYITIYFNIVLSRFSCGLILHGRVGRRVHSYDCQNHQIYDMGKILNFTSKTQIVSLNKIIAHGPGTCPGMWYSCPGVTNT